MVGELANVCEGLYVLDLHILVLSEVVGFLRYVGDAFIFHCDLCDEVVFVIPFSEGIVCQYGEA